MNNRIDRFPHAVFEVTPFGAISAFVRHIFVRLDFLLAMLVLRMPATEATSAGETPGLRALLDDGSICGHAVPAKSTRPFNAQIT